MNLHNLDVFVDDDNNIDSIRLGTDVDTFVFDCISNTSEEEMYKDIADFIKMLLKYENTCRIWP